MFRSLHKEERGYSLIEVMVSIMILALAILPMMSMFDMGLHGVTANSHYDKARTLANLKLEQAKSLPFTDVENNFPQAGVTTPYNGTAWFCHPDCTNPDPDFANFQYTVKKQYMTHPPANPGSSVNFQECTPLNGCNPPTDLIRVTVTVRWPNGNEYTTLGLVAR